MLESVEEAKLKEQNRKARQGLKEWRAEIKKVSFKTFCKDCEDVGKSGGYRNQGAKQELSCLRNGRQIFKKVSSFQFQTWPKAFKQNCKV